MGDDLMGGGFRGERISYAATREGAQTAVLTNRGRSLSDYSTTVTPRVFISFHIENESQVNLLRYQAKTSDKLEFTDYSVKEPFDEKWKTQCTERIRQSSAVVVAIGAETYSRPAVLWEIEKAHELGKPVIGMRIHRDENHRIPYPLSEHRDKVIEWNLDVLQAELDKKTGE